MNKQVLDLSSFAKAVKTLKEALAEHAKDKTNLFVRDSVIQRFEYTYELSHKMLKRFLLYSEFSGQDIAEMVFSNIIRTANEKGLLLNNLEKWEEYRKIRNMTSHTYDEIKAKLVVAIVPEFLQEAVFLLEQLQQRSKKL
ncbi:putative nucleotidyltransferases [Candidatus Termititenax aidoneus]|uniref:Nucleotidyltransferases n=1 Tax=Termititenax aidoneus TaxID=2218524 RepID=A0A388TC97_TERA1|nr:putative nucleotidyltransferases [Candidatus Termititenax aidoneus]